MFSIKSRASRVGFSFAISAMLAATALLGSAVDGQDFGKTYQVEVPIINLLKYKPHADKLEDDTATRKAADQTSNHQQPRPAQPSLGKRDIERPIESLLVKSENFSGSSIALSNNLNLSETVANKTNSVEDVDVDLFLADAGLRSANLSAKARIVSKFHIEQPTEQLVGRSRGIEDVILELEDALKAESSAKPDNPPVEPGLVNWHLDLSTAALQSKISGKPVFHFQLLGQLDQRFT